MKKEMKTVLKYPGSKWSMTSWIINNFPACYEDMTYLEPYFGSGAVFFNKKRSKVETINDIDTNVVNLFKVIREHPDKLASLVEMTPWARDEYKLSYISVDDPIENARRFLVRMWMAIGAKSSDKTGFRNNIKGFNGNLSHWHNRLPQRIMEVTERLQCSNNCIVQIENQPAIRIIERYDRDNVLMYIDPPYLLSTRSKRIYKHEMKDQDHEKLIDVLINHKAFIIISGYDNDMYNDLLRGWSKQYANVLAEGGKSAVEVIWMNYQPTRQVEMKIV
ncbi:DNA adenine methylase [Acetobacterium woodii]|uniref:Phage-like N6 adenine-specific DNA methylase n=1 Tax=Acetobacterium woodii (strain ATCC 29683 / DSM 1030 / JCM 2381 / KCTC 1655 / WB1) TaxID=931626 RepID=H6LCC7_ACEWD|nr:DNA adenine methylase [Acetobacterium woodii]AFA50242.1 phage-like N6 adenine-specific DNA methylase [Acetobacterium woodii DSM 1030]